MLAYSYWVLMSERILRIREPTITIRQLRARQLRPGNCASTIARTTFARNTKYAQNDGIEYFRNTFSRILLQGMCEVASRYTAVKQIPKRLQICQLFQEMYEFVEN